MDRIKFVAYAWTDGELQTDRVDLDPNNAEQVKKLRELNKRNNAMLVPLSLAVDEDGNELITIDETGMELLLKPGRRTATDWTDAMVKTAHELKVDGHKDQRIMLELYKRHDVEVTQASVSKTLRQEINTGVQLADGLRDKVKALMPAKGQGRKKYSDEFKADVVKYMEQGHSGVQAEAKFGVHNSQCNTWYRKQHGYRRTDKVDAGE